MQENPLNLTYKSWCLEICVGSSGLTRWVLSRLETVVTRGFSEPRYPEVGQSLMSVIQSCGCVPKSSLAELTSMTEPCWIQITHFIGRWVSGEGGLGSEI